MPLYEGMGLISEKHAIVLDLGSAYTKVGYAGEPHPHSIVPTPSNLFRKTYSADLDRLYDDLAEWIHKLYFEILLVNPKDRRVVVLESLIGFSGFKNVLAKVLFKHFEVLSVLFVPSHLMPMFVLGTRTGLVLDVGYTEASLIPIYEGVPVLKAWQAQPLASEAVHNALKIALDSKLEPYNEDDYIEDITVRFCFVSSWIRGQQLQKIRQDPSLIGGLSMILSKTAPAVTYPLKGDRIIHIDGYTRESVYEALFEIDNDCLSIPTMILDALSACPIDTRRELAANLIFVGGTTMTPGFKTRVVREVKHLMKSHPRYSDLKLDTIKVHSPPGRENSVCWIGASIFGATEAISTRSLLRDQYLKDETVPDWSNLKYNQLDCPDPRG